jgi:hypothetical protein
VKIEDQKWRIGKHPAVVVSDTKVENTNFPVPPNKEESDDSDIEYYGGYLIAESIGNDKIAKSIAAHPEFVKRVVCFVDAWEDFVQSGRRDFVEEQFSKSKELLSRFK